ncbi:amidase [Corynebacterium macginleyi]|uniref:amidase n=1 Tax=Corynebacterium macginleyi TaxID=38290 RepID=UPI001909B950|nr:amidase [Corynebacterium macginleyi]MBK4173953.1 amidase [Corynebacterium macginleyi]
MDFSIERLRANVQNMSPAAHGFTYLDLRRAPARTGRLRGWVLSAKDLNDVAGMPTTLGNAKRTYYPAVSDPFIANVEKQGATFIGKSSTPELGLRVDTEPVDLPHPDNPLYPGRTPGGSSGGAAVQVARGLVRAAQASDGGGSIRVPAAACGVVGFKPAGSTLSAEGFITRTVTDNAFLHGHRMITPRARIGLLLEPLFAATKVQAHHLRAAREAADRLRATGFEVIAIAPYPQERATFAHFRKIFTSRFAALPQAEGYAAWVAQQGASVSAGELNAAQRHVRDLPKLLAQQWQVDAIITPMLTADPPPRGYFMSLPHAANFAAQTRWSPWASLFNMAQLPAISVPCAIPAHPPVGVQVGGITLSDAQLLGLAHILHP